MLTLPLCVELVCLLSDLKLLFSGLILHAMGAEFNCFGAWVEWDQCYLINLCWHCHFHRFHLL